MLSHAAVWAGALTKAMVGLVASLFFFLGTTNFLGAMCVGYAEFTLSALFVRDLRGRGGDPVGMTTQLAVSSSFLSCAASADRVCLPGVCG